MAEANKHDEIPVVVARAGDAAARYEEVIMEQDGGETPENNNSAVNLCILHLQNLCLQRATI